MKILYLFSLSLFVFALNAHALDQKIVDKIEEKELWLDKQWLKHLHYRPGTIWGYTGEVDDEKFYVHEDGKISPKEEMLKTVELMLSSNNKKQEDNVVCRFPGRVKYLKDKLGLPQHLVNFDKCAKYKDFINRNTPKRVFLVFSSYYLESPASAFGHTFLRFSKNEEIKDGKRNELLDAGINYGAVVTTQNPVMYAIFGLLGFFRGVYSLVPYYYKVREYNDHESRDLWSYELNLNRQQIVKLMDHLWEIGNSWAFYFFFDENCSYNMLTLLEAVNPEWDLIDPLPELYAIPATTIQVLTRAPGLVVKEPTYRPSIKRIFEHAKAQLTPEEFEFFDSMLDSENEDELMNSDKPESFKTKVIDVTMDYLDFKHSKQIIAEKGPYYDWKRRLLKKRARLPITEINRDIKTPKREQPHIGHDSNRWDLGYGEDKLQGPYENIFFRFALHDLLDPVIGQPEFAAIKMFAGGGKYYNDTKKFMVEDLTFVEITTLNPLAYRHYPISLHAKIAAERLQDGACDRCLAPHMNFASGLTKVFAKNRLTTSLFMDFDFAYNSQMKIGNWKASAGPWFYSLVRWHDRFTQAFSAKWRRHTLQKMNYWSYGHEARVNFTKYMSLRIKNERNKLSYDHSADLLFYF